MAISDNLKYVTERIHSACLRSGQQTGQVSLLAVTKTVSAEHIRAAAALGLTLIGENRVQEAWAKVQLLPDLPLSWHMIGHLQSNKVKRALQFATVIESVDSPHIARELDHAAAAQDSIIECFLEVNTSGESRKFGVAPDATEALASEIARLPHLHLTGLMTIGALSPDSRRIRSCFQSLKTLQERLNTSGYGIRHLSMGMSDDFEIAIEEGATLIRLGRALFGERI
ncbi:MAG TPA: YggS family pyridoxal phosphate-dependent enzyme [bacterium]|nr:YggS family pyridoxal phosphate-dependent enzyme [bacterium]HQG45790.1 YggS family pyridoxal phosphate-dependent enzyme [bacterium]HQI47694.1 YggS family pyridoxal phosphate-dependent enzyme [bacterium]HQJ63466.1 YggS family pyridoxal phosphate-dependent enzyme [bacterium]